MINTGRYPSRAGTSPDNVTDIAPVLADIDGDRDYDMWICWGNSNSDIRYNENTGANPEYISDGNPATTTSPAWSELGRILDKKDGEIWCESQYGKPAFTDLDNDGDLNLVCGLGNADGKLKYWENTGINSDSPDGVEWTYGGFLTDHYTNTIDVGGCCQYSVCGFR